jgi:hypothetical protein
MEQIWSNSTSEHANLSTAEARQVLINTFQHPRNQDGVSLQPIMLTAWPCYV